MARAVVLLAVLSEILLFNTYAEAAKCNCQCPFSYQPICAADSNGLEETYPNKCAMECYKCTHDEVLVIRNHGECTSNSLNPVIPQETRKASTKTSAKKCNCQCPFNYKPICAADTKGVEETYPNICALECYTCTHGKELTIRKQGECSKKSGSRPMNLISDPKTSSKCNCRCPLNYDPVCAADSKGVEETFPNKCSLQCYMCTHEKEYVIRKQGECVSKPIDRPKPPRGNTSTQRKPTNKCNCQCPFNYDPVCYFGPSGTQQTFNNKCAFECYKCTTNLVHDTWKKGECPDRIQPSSKKQNTAAKCKCDCTLDYTPVCAVDINGEEMTFPNQCSLDCYNCSFERDFVFRRRGECPQRSATKSRRPSSRTA